MGRRDVLKSLLRSTASSAVTSLVHSPITGRIQKLVAEAAFGRATVSDAQLTRAVAHGTHVAAATVTTALDCLRVDASLEDGTQLCMAVYPVGVSFAPGGAKELAFAVEPREAAHSSHCRDVIAAVAGELARSLWKPALVGAPRSDQLAFVTFDADRLVVDLRSVPEVRWALAQSTRAALIEAFSARSFEINNKRLELALRNPLARKSR
jgi:hypothetical protein